MFNVFAVGNGIQISLLKFQADSYVYMNRLYNRSILVKHDLTYAIIGLLYAVVHIMRNI